MGVVDVVKERTKKMCVIVLLITILTYYVVPPKQAQAIPIALPLGIEVGVGAYVLLALGVVGAASAFGQTEYADAAYDHATYVWNTTQDTIKAEILASYKAAVDAGKKTMDISTSVMGYLTNRLGSLFVMSSPTTYGSVDGYNFSKAVRETCCGYDWYGFYPKEGMVYYYDFVNEGTRYVGYNTTASSYDKVYGLVRFFNYPSSPNKSYMYIGGAPINLTASYFGGEFVSSAVAYSQIMAYTHSFFKVMTKAEYDTIQAKKASAIQTVASIPAIATPAVGDFVAHPTKDKTKTATWSPDKGWVLDDGTTVAPKDLTFEYPKPTIAADGAISVPISGVQTDVLTGEKVGTANPGDGGGTGPTKPLSTLVTTRFPFSLPWDIYRVLGVLNAPAKTPVIDVNQNFMGMPFKFKYSFAWLDPYIPWFRSILLIGFVIFLITGTRKLLGGAQ